MRTRPALLLFDLDDVLVHYDHGLRCAALSRFLGGTVDADDIRRVLFGPDGLEFGCDRGEYELDEYLARLRDAQGWTLDAAQFTDARRVATRLDADMHSLCKALAPQARLAIFTNNGAWVAERMAAIVPGLDGLFDAGIVCSGQLRRSKPDPGAFAACAARLGVAPQHVLFTDDKRANVEGARASGMDAVPFTGLPALRRDLRARGFELTEDPVPGVNDAH